MKLRLVVVLAGLGAMFSSAAAFAIPIPPPEEPPPPKVVADPIEVPGPHLALGSTLLADARLGHASLATGAGTAETYLFATVTGIDSQLATAPPLDLALVVDRSGSMKGRRIANAIAAANTAVDGLKDGDTVLVVSFDTQAEVVLEPTTISAETRPDIRAAIEGIRLGGDTCISCGLEAAKRALDRAPIGGDRVRRMLLLSDGATNHGIKDVAGLRGLASLIREQSCAVTTIGVDLDYDEKVMSAIASEANGNHYFVANPETLSSVFTQEFLQLLSTVAQDAALVVEPAPGVEIDEVFDRSFSRDGRRVVVPLGTYGMKEEKSLLLKLRVPVDHDGRQPVADVKLAYRDLREHRNVSYSGTLALDVKSDGAQAELDPFVRARVERSQTARTLAEASELIAGGRAEEARRRLAGRTNELGNVKQDVSRSAPAGNVAPTRARGFRQDFDDQVAALEKAQKAADEAAASKQKDAAPTKAAPKALQELNLSREFR
ncbi:MAG: VWA domain-containing protein [Labilithrix sp.]|nr:VWA domain-containing protein [Labilithrix sp.]MCW5815764.1 VWA domain-containing protein [Labilithrix sp.]